MWFAVAALGCAILAATLLVWPAPRPAESPATAASPAPDVVVGRIVTCAVARHTRSYDVVRGEGRRFRLAHGARRVRVAGLGNCRVVARSGRKVVLRSPLHAPLTLRNAHNLVFQGLDFQGTASDQGEASAIIFITGSSHDIVFRNCIIGTNGFSDGNGVTVLDLGDGIHDITFDHCRFAYQPRMGFECISRRFERGEGDWPGYRRVNLIGCSFAAQGSQAISYDDDDPGHVYNGEAQGAGYCTLSGNTVKGAGLNAAFPWRCVLEINRTRNMTVTRNWFGPGVGGCTNLRCNVSDTAPMGWTFSGNTWNATAYLPGVKYGWSGTSTPTIWYMANVRGGVTVDDTMIGGRAPYSTGSWGYFEAVNGADFGGSRVRGCVPALSPMMWPRSSNLTWPTAF
jgi:hypothetical protein